MGIEEPGTDPPALEITPTKRFRADLKKVDRRGKDLSKLRAVIASLSSGRRLDPKHRDHALQGAWSGWRECHIEFDWIFIDRVEGATLILGPTGTHSDLLD